MRHPLELTSFALLFGASLAACGNEVSPGEGVCLDFENAEPLQAAVVFRVVNATTQTLYLPAEEESCSGAPFKYELTSPSGQVIKEDGPCGGGCEKLQKDAMVACDMACAMPQVRSIPAGATFEHTWDLTHWQQVQMPADCVGESGQPVSTDAVTCLQRKIAEDGAHRFVVDAFSACLQGEQTCACNQVHPDGTCSIGSGAGAELTGRQLTADVTFELPGTNVVEIRFEEVLCAPSNASPCGAYNEEGCCSGETCVIDGSDGPTCTIIPPPG